MATATILNILTSMQILQQAKELYKPKNPVLVRLKNLTEDQIVTFESITGMKDITVLGLPSPCIAPGSVGDMILNATSFSGAGMTIEYKGKKGKKAYTIEITCAWTSPVESTATLVVNEDGAAAGTPAKLSASKDSVSSLKYTGGETVDAMLSAGGSLVEIAVVDKDLI